MARQWLANKSRSLKFVREVEEEAKVVEAMAVDVEEAIGDVNSLSLYAEHEFKAKFWMITDMYTEQSL